MVKVVLPSEEVTIRRADESWVISDEHGEYTTTENPEKALDIVRSLISGTSWEYAQVIECSECGGPVYGDETDELQCGDCGVSY